MSEALRLAELLTNLKITVKGRDNAEAMEEAAAELRRLHDLVTEDSILLRRQRDEIAQLNKAFRLCISRINILETERAHGIGEQHE